MTLKLEVGKTYYNFLGQSVQIIGRDNKKFGFEGVTDSGVVERFTAKGRWDIWGYDSDYDLVTEKTNDLYPYTQD